MNTRQQLANWQEKLAEAENDFQHALKRRDALRKIVEGAEELQHLADEVGGFIEIDRETGEPVGADPVPAVGRTPRGRDALRKIMGGGERSEWEPHELIDELRRRGWAPEGTDLTNAVRVALARMIKTDEVERIGTGRYRYLGSPTGQQENGEGRSYATA